jgi:hypothetical protein
LASGAPESDGSGSGIRAGEKTGFEGWNLAPGIDPNARIAVRFGLEGDKTLRSEAKKSEWYKRHGRAAGKETASSRREVYAYDGDSSHGRRGRNGDQVTFEGRGADGNVGEGRDFAKRIGKGRVQGRRGPYERDGGGDRDRRAGGRTVEDLDRELENIRGGGADAGGEISDNRTNGGRRGERRPKRGKDDLDAGE